jgi:hypothetical protein
VIRGVTSPVGVFAAGFRWGAVTGTTAGELLRVRYTGATVVEAELVLADGRVLSVTVAAGELSVLLPPDTPEGPATLRAELADGTIEELVIVLHGAVVVAERPGWITPAVRPRPPRTLTSPSRIALRSRTRLRPSPARVRSTVVLRADTRRVRLAAPERLTLPSPSAITLAAGTRATAVGGQDSRRLALRSATLIARRDGPALEEALLLDLL